MVWCWNILTDCNKLQDFDNILTVNGQTAVEVDMESLEDKPWRKPGADITDYFNYGFTEETWAAYCNRSDDNSCRY